ncbi:MAG: HAMP domain-containing histidine kinase [Candidatus Delongbacteria bacterium]|nr:HAMP domain-containing histidine kinase [Candidatus Delongbacteria bacterium]MBN2836887.1 HAMP domain-containing histidine kinase [Candidatus Delongbacteria bacterium]
MRIKLFLLIISVSLTSFLIFYHNFYSLIIILIIFSIYLIISIINEPKKIHNELDVILKTLINNENSGNLNIKPGSVEENNLLMTVKSFVKKQNSVRNENENYSILTQTIFNHLLVPILILDENYATILENSSFVHLKKKYEENKEIDKKFEMTIFNFLKDFKSGERKVFKGDNKIDNYLLTYHETEIDNKTYKIITLQDINSELENQEVDSWSNLVKVLTHEIMNSITPITSLSSLLVEMFESDKYLNNCNNSSDFLDGLNAINKRSDGLIKFVRKYRELTKIPLPVISEHRVSELFSGVKDLFNSKLDDGRIYIKFISSDEVVKADKSLIEQVLINLIKNSISAIGDNKGDIEIGCYVNSENRTCIYVKDNGQGILDYVQKNIFIPFFTTKENGSGIGLAFSKQVMRMHGGTIHVDSVPDKETIFTLTF